MAYSRSKDALGKANKQFNVKLQIQQQYLGTSSLIQVSLLLPVYVLVPTIIVWNQLIESLPLQPSLNVEVLKTRLKKEMEFFHVCAFVRSVRKVEGPGWAEGQEG